VSDPTTAIRNMTEDDISVVARIASENMTYPWSPQVFRDCLRADYHAWALTQEEGVLSHEVIGFLVALIQAEECQLMNICVDKRFRHQGYGRQILQHLIDYCRGRGVSHISLEVRKSNTDAIKIYHAFGFMEVGERKYYYPADAGREDALIFVLGLIN